MSLPCESAEACFLAAGNQSDSGIHAREQLAPRLQSLSSLQERYPGSIWAKRAGLLIGILLSERDPSEAQRYFNTAQRDWPLLDDYIRFWIGEALLKRGEPGSAAAQFESVPDAAPDTLLTARALFKAGEAWARVGQCQKAIDPLTRAAALGPLEPVAPWALLTLADCQFRENRAGGGVATLKQIWTRYPHSPESREAAARLAKHKDGWSPTPDEIHSRALSFSTLALHAEAVDEFQKFLLAAPHDRRVDDVRLKVGVAFVRLKRYDVARDVFLSQASGTSKEAGEAAVWLGRVYLRQGAGERLMGLPHALPTVSLTSDQKATIRLLRGMWLEDQDQFEQALHEYRQMANAEVAPSQRSEALWRVAWVQYRSGQWLAALDAFQEALAGKEDPQVTPQVLYWMARTHEQVQDTRAAERYLELCRRFAFTYYCQLARSGGKVSPLDPAPPSVVSMPLLIDGKPDVARDRRYLKAVELKLLGMDQEAARELSTLMEQYAHDRASLLSLSTLLSDAGAYHQALRLARVHFRETLERGGDDVPPGIWRAAYPTAYLSVIRKHAGARVHPSLAAAIIREESQYDSRALSRVGAIGLMQVMPATAQAVARKFGIPSVNREELFEQEVNIRFGVLYLDQLLRQFEGNALYAIAAYNAGPPAVLAWMAKYGNKPPDEFVELIPYQETRQYVKRVLRSYREYVRLAGSDCSGRSLDKVC